MGKEYVEGRAETLDELIEFANSWGDSFADSMILTNFRRARSRCCAVGSMPVTTSLMTPRRELCGPEGETPDGAPPPTAGSGSGVL
jgi:hypothetical protein